MHRVSYVPIVVRAVERWIEVSCVSMYTEVPAFADYDDDL